MSYDAWKQAAPTDDMPSVGDAVETCEHCGHDVAPVDPAWCMGCSKYSDQKRRPEHEGDETR